MVGFVRPQAWTFKESHVKRVRCKDEILRTYIAFQIIIKMAK